MTILALTDDEFEMRRITQSKDMADLLFEIYHNLANEFKHKDEVDPNEVFERIGELFMQHNIDIDELIEPFY